MPSNSTDQQSTIVVGAGISGLTTAYALEEQGVSVDLLESRAEPGGVIKSERVGSFLFEYGPNSLLKKSQEVEWLIDSLDLNEEVEQAGEQASRRYILRNDQLHPVPMDSSSFFTTDLLSWSGKASLLLEPFRKPGQPSERESLASFVRRRLGDEALQYLVNPMVAGVYAGSPEQMGASASAKKFVQWEREYGSLLNGAMASYLERPDQETSSRGRRELISFTNGMETIVRRLAKKLSGSIRYNHEVQNIDTSENSKRYRIHAENTDRQETVQFEADRVILTTPAYTTAELIHSFDSTLSSHLRNISYPSLAVVLFGYETYDGSHPLDGFGFLVPDVEDRRILGTLWNGTIFPNRAPANGAVLTTFLGGARNPDRAQLDEEELINCVREELDELLGLNSSPDVVRVKKWPRSIPQYETGHGQIIKRLETFEENHPGFFIHGNYREGVSVPACINKGVNYARRVTKSSGR